MMTQQLAYKPYGIGAWTHTTVSKDVAETLAKEYVSYGWPVKIDGTQYDEQTKKVA